VRGEKKTLRSFKGQRVKEATLLFVFFWIKKATRPPPERPHKGSKKEKKRKKKKGIFIPNAPLSRRHAVTLLSFYRR